MKHTIESVKETLPDVQLKSGNRINSAILSGRENRFATVTINNWYGFQFSWEAIVRSLNNQEPLLIGDINYPREMD